MNITDHLDDIEHSLASPMRTYKENATEDAPALLAALRAALKVADDIKDRSLVDGRVVALDLIDDITNALRPTDVNA